jgi:hypothetical protein
MKLVLNWIHSVTGVSPLTCAAVGVGLVVAVVCFEMIFGGIGGFRQDIDNDAKIPLLDKDYDYVESRRSHNKISIWLLLSIGCGLLAYHQLPRWFPDLFR